MKEELKLAAKITAKTSLTWVTIFLTGSILTMISFFLILFQNTTFAESAHGAVYAFIINLFLNNLGGFILFIGAPVFVFLYFMIANKIATQSMIYHLWENKMASYIDAKVVLIVDKLTASNDWSSTISNEIVLKLQLLEANRNDKESSKIKRKTISYLINKIELDDIDLTNKDLKLSNIISYKLNKFMSESIEPSFLFFWLLFSLQFVLAIWAQF